MWYKVIFWFILGSIFGSFGNVLIYRPIAGLKVSKPSFSVCPQCGSRIKWYDNIPIFSYLYLRGRCRNCKNPISIRYPLVEVIVAIVFALHSFYFPTQITLGINAVFFVSFVSSIIDFKIMMLPDYAWIVVSIVGLYYNILAGELLINLIAGIIILSVLLLLKLKYKNGIGEGDIFLLPAFAFLTGLFYLPYLVLVASLLGLIYYFLSSKKERIIPFGPFICISGYIFTLLRLLILPIM